MYLYKAWSAVMAHAVRYRPSWEITREFRFDIVP